MNSQIVVNQATDLLGVGFRAFKGFTTIGATQQIDYRMSYPVDLLRLLNFGNAVPENRQLNIGGFAFESMVRTNYYLGYQQQYNEKLRLGGRVKFIVGQWHAYADKMDAIITTTDSSTLIAETDVRFRTAGINDIFANEGIVDSAGFGNTFFPGNLGVGFDIGGSYDLNDKWNFSASVLDLGFVHWKTNTTEYTSNGRFEFDGVEADLAADQPISSYEAIVDSLEKAFDFQETEGVSYNRSLSSRVFAAVNYSITPKHTFGLLYHARIWDSRVFSDVGVNYQGRLSRNFQLSINYSVINGTYNNLGAGFFVKAGPLQLYVISDNVLHSLMYENLQSSSIRAGLNIALFARKDKAKKQKEATETPAPEL